MNTCTVIIDATGHRCGRPAVATFVSKRSGEIFAECAEHEVRLSEPEATGPRVGQACTIEAGRYRGEAGVIDHLTPVMADVCLGRTGRVVRVRRDSLELY